MAAGRQCDGSGGEGGAMAAVMGAVQWQRCEDICVSVSIYSAFKWNDVIGQNRASNREESSLLIQLQLHFKFERIAASGA